MQSTNQPAPGRQSKKGWKSSVFCQTPPLEPPSPILVRANFSSLSLVVVHVQSKLSWGNDSLPEILMGARVWLTSFPQYDKNAIFFIPTTSNTFLRAFRSLADARCSSSHLKAEIIFTSCFWNSNLSSSAEASIQLTQYRQIIHETSVGGNRLKDNVALDTGRFSGHEKVLKCSNSTTHNQNSQFANSCWIFSQTSNFGTR